MTKVSIVIGALYGDEGKGSFVNYLCSQTIKPLVIRFNGGHQVGHTVVNNDGTKHVFSNFGSGTLQNTPTYWSEYCTVSPVGIQKEGRILNELGIEPELYLNANAMVTTPFDILQNHKLEASNNHGSVGVGFGTTIQRNEDNYRLYVRDLQYSKIRDEKLKLIINNYYNLPFNPACAYQNKETRKIYDNFIAACDDLIGRYEIINDLKSHGLYNHDMIFEGAQGIMLDKNYGFFPHVTRSNTTSKNALEIIKTIPLNVDINTYYITRAYQTRHGNGYMTNEGSDISYIKNNPKETNVEGFQGEFRKSILDLDVLNYAISCDKYHNPDMFSKKKLVITCLDQVPENIPITVNGVKGVANYEQISRFCKIKHVFPVYSDTGFKFNNDKQL
jgi:adenylosuccinate synthase